MNVILNRQKGHLNQSKIRMQYMCYLQKNKWPLNQANTGYVLSVTPIKSC